jgi:hypothetical protein
VSRMHARMNHSAPLDATPTHHNNSPACTLCVRGLRPTALTGLNSSPQFFPLNTLRISYIG